MHISAQEIASLLNYPELVSTLKSAFAAKDFLTPERMHLSLPHNNISLIMPAWNKQYFGLKQILACPANPGKGLPIIQGKYDLYNIHDGMHLCSIDAAKLTAVRTAATSVLASSFFVEKADKICILGAGVVAEQLLKAYGDYFMPKEILIWNRTKSKAEHLVNTLKDQYPVKSIVYIEREIQNSRIISSATHSNQPVLLGQWINFETHIDLVGSYRKDLREADDELILKADIYLDEYSAINQTGDLYWPIKDMLITKANIKASLFELCSGKKSLRNNKMTLFKSVGHAIEDLAAAIYFYERKSE